jgi:hypothetical protein
MYKPLLVTLLSVVGTFDFLKKSPDNAEQIAFDYFISEILKEDFKNVSVIEFTGKTEDSFSGLGKYTVCLKPEKLQSLVKRAADGRAQTKEIKYDKVKDIAVTGFTRKSKAPKLYLYHSVHVADNFYVFLTMQIPEEPRSNYVFEITPEGQILRSCKME